MKQFPQKLSKKEIFHNFSRWLSENNHSSGPKKNDRSEIKFEEYRSFLIDCGTTASQAEIELQIVKAALAKIENEKWNRYYSRPGTELTAHNGFLAGVVEKLPVGRALDVGMGQGRNSLYLAKKGWTTVGFDSAARGVLSARRQARSKGLSLTTIICSYDEFQFGEEKWDLILLFYVPVREISDRIINSLKPGGTILVESYHSDSQSKSVIGDKVLFERGELPALFKSLEIILYKEIIRVPDFGKEEMPIVQLHAVR